MSEFISEELVDMREESGDRIPDDLTVAPIRVDDITVQSWVLYCTTRIFRISQLLGSISLTLSVQLI